MIQDYDTTQLHKNKINNVLQCKSRMECHYTLYKINYFITSHSNTCNIPLVVTVSSIILL